MTIESALRVGCSSRLFESIARGSTRMTIESIIRVGCPRIDSNRVDCSNRSFEPVVRVDCQRIDLNDNRVGHSGRPSENRLESSRFGSSRLFGWIIRAVCGSESIVRESARVEPIIPVDHPSRLFESIVRHIWMRVQVRISTNADPPVGYPRAANHHRLLCSLGSPQGGMIFQF